MEKVGDDEKELLTALQSSQQEPNVAPPIEKQPSSFAVENAGSSSLNILPQVEAEADQDEGLIFYDPQAEAKAEKELDMIEKQRNKMNL